MHRSRPHGRGLSAGAFPLTMIEKGRKVKITSISGGWGLRHRLCDMGLYEGTTVKVIRNDAAGPVILKILDSRVIVGRGQAHKIMVNNV